MHWLNWTESNDSVTMTTGIQIQEENESWIALRENIRDTQTLNGNNTEDIDQ